MSWTRVESFLQFAVNTGFGYTDIFHASPRKASEHTFKEGRGHQSCLMVSPSGHCLTASLADDFT